MCDDPDPVALMMAANARREQELRERIIHRILSHAPPLAVHPDGQLAPGGRATAGRTVPPDLGMQYEPEDV